MKRFLTIFKFKIVKLLEWLFIHKKKNNKTHDKTKWIGSFPKPTQSRLVPFQIHGQSQLDWVSFLKNRLFSRESFCVCGWRQGGGDGFVGWWVCGCVNDVCMEVTGCGDGCVGFGVGVCSGKWVCEWVTFGQVALFIYANTQHEYSVLDSIFHKVDWVGFGKRTAFVKHRIA